MVWPSIITMRRSAAIRSLGPSPGSVQKLQSRDGLAIISCRTQGRAMEPASGVSCTGCLLRQRPSTVSCAGCNTFAVRACMLQHELARRDVPFLAEHVVGMISWLRGQSVCV